MNVKRKSSFFIMLLIAMVLLFDSVMAASTSAMKITGETVKVRPGEEANVEINVSGNPGFAYISLEILYNAEQLELISVKNGKVAQEMIWGTYIVLSSDENSTNNGTLVELKFKTRNDTLLESYPIQINCIECNDYDENDVPVTTVSGKITVSKGSTGGGGGGGFSQTKTYLVKFETNGGSDVENKTVSRNGVLEAPEAPAKEGFKFEGWFTDKELTTAYDFTAKVTSNFTLYAKWTEIEKESEDKDDETTEWKNPFSDVKADDWFYENVRYVTQNKLMNGVSDDEFAPNATLTRAMLVTVLYRNEGEPAVNKSIPFADIDMGAWYASAVVWAKQNGIVNGVTENEFAPNANITREQIATIMFRYAQYKGMDAITLEENLHFDDANEISEYAISAMNWAVGTGLMKGKSATTINPKDNATRAEIAAILQRFAQAAE